MSDPPQITGGCQCGAVRWRATAAPAHSTVCHCENCRRASGAQSVAWLTFGTEAFAFSDGHPARYRADTGAERTFCGRCGSPLTYRGVGREHEVDVTTGTADDPEAFPPTRDIFPEDRLSWVVPVARQEG